MKIHIIGGNGTVGDGIKGVLSSTHEVTTSGRSDFDVNKCLFFDEKLFDTDVIIHAAGVTDELIAENLEQALQKSTYLIQYLINKLTHSSVKYFTYISTVHVYGRLKSILNCTTVASPISLYAVLHLLTEKLLIDGLSRTNIKLLILRVPTVYGVPVYTQIMRRPKIIQNSFPKELAKSGCIELNSSGEQYRMFVSNSKIGNLIKYWLSASLDDMVTITPIKGRDLKIKDFAQLCINKFITIRKKNGILKIPQSIPVHNEVRTEVIPAFDCDEIYTLENYIEDFFHLDNLA